VHPSLEHTVHRPWPLPEGRWTWRQSWRDLAFLHWRIPAKALRSAIPEGLSLQEFDGSVWLGVVPFWMAGVMRRPLPDVPGVSAFPELNVRTYVDIADGESRPGVWFFSLDATKRLAVWAARRFFHLPYYRATIRIDEVDGRYNYYSRRRDGRATFAARYGPTSQAYSSEAGTLEHWLTERYSLYAEAPDGQLWRSEVHHPAWPLQQCEIDIETNDVVPDLEVDIARPPDVVHFSKRIDVVVWSPVKIDIQ
jgi:uncharacterized protein YqjF (DUF2071 family)